MLDSDPDLARATARKFLKNYLGLPNYVNNLKRTHDLTDADFIDGGSDRLIDTIVAWGDEDAIGQRVRAHLDAGADHVCIQIAGGWRDVAREPLRRLAAAVTAS